MFTLFIIFKMRLSDLWLIDPELARSLQRILDISDGDSIGELLGVYFLASKNPLVDSSSVQFNDSSISSQPTLDINDDEISQGKKARYENSRSYIELVEGGSDILVERGNRSQFVELFLNHTLYLSVKDAADDFIAGLKHILCSPLYDMCTHTEVLNPLLI